MFLGAPEIARILWFNEMFLKVKDIPGIIVEFGSQFGTSFNIFQMLKIIHEPWNPSRKLVSFTTFNKGLTNVNKKDGSMVEEGDYGVPQDWKEIFETILEINTTQSPVEPNYEIIEGDVSKTLPKYLIKHPETLISLAHFDLDIYSPTKSALQACLNVMPKGGVLVFDELNHPGFPWRNYCLK